MRDRTPTKTLNDFEASSSASAPATRHLQARPETVQGCPHHTGAGMPCLITSRNVHGQVLEPCHQQAKRCGALRHLP